LWYSEELLVLNDGSGNKVKVNIKNNVKMKVGQLSSDGIKGND
jgi:hypothetical protein